MKTININNIKHIAPLTLPNEMNMATDDIDFQIKKIRNHRKEIENKHLRKTLSQMLDYVNDSYAHPSLITNLHQMIAKIQSKKLAK